VPADTWHPLAECVQQLAQFESCRHVLLQVGPQGLDPALSLSSLGSPLDSLSPLSVVS
jgi:hypothetical protein